MQGNHAHDPVNADHAGDAGLILASLADNFGM
jgi:hypothetical protein